MNQLNMFTIRLKILFAGIAGAKIRVFVHTCFCKGYLEFIWLQRQVILIFLFWL